MLKVEFITMAEQDILTADNPMLTAIVEVMKEVLKTVPVNTEIDNSKNPMDCLKKMEDYARTNQKNSCYAFSSKAALNFIKEYLEIKTESTETKSINLDDFI